MGCECLSQIFTGGTFGGKHQDWICLLYTSDGDSSGKDSDDESEEDAEVTEASAGKIGVLLSDDDEDAKIDSEEMTLSLIHI